MLWKRSAFSLAQELCCIVRSIPWSALEGNEGCGGETMLGQPCHMDKGLRENLLLSGHCQVPL